MAVLGKYNEAVNFNDLHGLSEIVFSRVMKMLIRLINNAIPISIDTK
jgi:hypothetical protein